MDRQRIVWIDNAKAIGIALVVLGHQCLPPGAGKFIYSFHMPLFFFISGYLFSIGPEASFAGFLRKKAKTLLVPYIFFAAITYLLWLAIGRNLGEQRQTDVPALKPLLGILYSNGVDDWLVFDTPLWFLTCLFLVELAYFGFCRLKKGKIAFIASLPALAALGYLQSVSGFPRLPWGANVALTGIVFYGIGNLARGLRLERLGKKPLVLGIPVLLSCNLASVALNAKVDMDYNLYGNIFLFYLGAFSGIGAAICASLLIPGNAPFRAASKNTLAIMALHKPAVGPAMFIAKAVFGIQAPPASPAPLVLYNVLLSFIILAALSPAILWLNRFAPRLVGKGLDARG